MPDDNKTVETPTSAEGLRRTVELRNCLLLVDSGPDAGKQFGPLGEQTTIGRHDWSDIGLSDPSVSKQHCELTSCDDGLRLRDLGSTNGVFHDGMRVYDLVFDSERSFRIGATTLRLSFQEGSRSHTTVCHDTTRTLVGGSPAVLRLFGMMQRVAPRDLPILLLGETGTGKTAVARAMHFGSPRRERPFVTINCAALPPELAESTLFGHVRGAFTGAIRSVPGIFEQAGGGSVLLDEIGDMPLALQAKLLTVLESGRVRPVGADREVSVAFRLFCATNRPLGQDVAAGRFRQDLYYRIAGLDIVVPTLRERASDIPMLAEWFVLGQARKIREAGGKCGVRAVSDDALRMLEQHPWPGNVRELENVLARAVALAESATITPDDVLLTTWNPAEDAPVSMQSPAGTDSGTEPDDDNTPPLASFKDFKAALLDVHERAYFQQLMVKAGGRVPRAAQLSGLSRVHVRAMVKKYGL